MRLSALLLLVTLAAASCGPVIEVPTYEVQRINFVHRVRAEGVLKAAETTKISVPSTVKSRVRLTWIAPDGSVLAAGDPVARFDTREFERELDSAQADRAGARHEIDRTRAENDIQLAEHQRDLQVAELELVFARSFQKQDQEIYSRYEIVEAEIDEELADSRRDHAAGMGGIQSTLGRAQIELLEIRIRKSELEIEEAEAGLQSIEVRSPDNGILTVARTWRGDPLAVGAEMWRGQEIAEIPSLEKIEAEVFVLEADARGLEPGRKAEVLVEAHPERPHPAAIARVDALAKPRFRGSPVQFFGVTLEFDRTDPATMKPGQRVVATLLLGAASDALVVPRQAIFQEDRHNWVYRRRGSGFEVREIETGISSAGQVVVTNGLQSGDRVALVRPPEGGSPESPDPEAGGPETSAPDTGGGR